MTDELFQKELRLQSVTTCPVCNNRRLEYWRDEKFGPQIDEEDDFLWRLPERGDEAVARFWCGLKLWLDAKARIAIRRDCPLATQEAVRKLNRPIICEAVDAVDAVDQPGHPSNLHEDRSSMAATKPTTDLRLEFTNVAPDTILVVPVQTAKLGHIQVPVEAISYAFFSYGESGPAFVGPHVFLSTAPRVLTMAEAVAGGIVDQEYADSFAARGATSFGVVAWDAQTNGTGGSMVVPLLEQIVLADRATLRQVWPETNEERLP